MASKEVVRQDVVQIGFDVDFSELTKLTDSLDDMKKAVSGGVGDDAFEDLAKESKKATEEVEGLGDAVKKIKPDGVDDTKDGLKDTGKEAEKAGKEMKKAADTDFDKTTSGVKRLGSALGKVALSAAKFVAGGIAAGVAGVGAIVGKSVANYADYEQLTGGVDTLFKDSSGIVQENAKNAFKTAGLSANEYMETVTSFSASLISSLGGDTDKAANVAQRAITDMSDNANKMGTDMSSIQYAYQGFAKQNYTMLDNLKLGYGGSQEEMKRLLKDAQKLSGVKYDMSSYADVVEAIHVIQENMGITGTTALEAEKTISGSLASLKASWSNTLTSLVSGGDDFDDCVEDLVKSAKTFGKNIMPAITKSLGGVGELIEELAPMIEKEIPTLVDTLLPPLISAATSLVKGLIIALPNIVSAVVKEIPDILSGIWDAIESLLAERMPSIKKVGGFFENLKGFFTENASAIKKFAGGLIGAIAAFKLLSKLKSIGSIFGAKGGGAGGKGGGFFGGFQSFANMKPTMILKGFANLAIVLAGFTILAAAFAAVAPWIAQLSDMKSILEMAAIMGVLGLLGFTLSKFAAAIGAVPIPVVLSGLASMALVLVGFTAIVTAFAALNSIPGFNDFITKGGELLANLFRILGEMVGSVIGGIGEGISNSLPAIGENLALFGESIKPMMEAFSGTDVSGVGDFLLALGSFFALMAGQEVLSFLTGGTDYATLATDLTSFATNSKGFFDTVATIPEASFALAKSFFECLAGITGLPKEGGVFQWFTGNVNYDTIASGLGKLASEDVTKFFGMVAGLPEAGFERAKTFFETLAGVKELPKSGGVFQWFTGNINYAGLVTGLKQLSDDGIIGFFQKVATIPENAFTQATTFFDTLAGTKSLGKSGGVAGFFAGEVDFTALADGLGQLGEKGVAFFASINELNMENLNGFFEFLSNSEGLSTEVGKLALRLESAIGDMIETIKTKLFGSGQDLMQGLADGMEDKRSALVEKARSIAQEITSTINESLDIHSPSRVMIDSGRNVGLGAVEGMDSTLPVVRSASDRMSNAILESRMPDSTSSTTNHTETNYFNPQFALTINGNQNDRNTERTVKQWVREGIEETFASMNRRNPRTTTI